MTFYDLGRLIYNKRPKGSTGFYITRHTIIYGFRTNASKAPSNWVSFASLRV